ncbi:MAG TPA: 3'-5' exonuclease [Pedomonas sp.]|uniref:3'-5' exonuclease n=1 Tax=Pedomonas sp. TaxID=2976421 RepID=UPI002F3F25B8
MSVRILAIDFETADNGTDSACAVGLALIQNGKITEQSHYLIRPPRQKILYSDIHGIFWEDVADQPSFGELWPELEPTFKQADFFAAHSARFDRSILYGSCAAYGIFAPNKPWLCTVKLARAAWNIFPTKLPNVCEHFDIPLRHHDAMSDARACAEITLRAWHEGRDLSAGIMGSVKYAVSRV